MKLRAPVSTFFLASTVVACAAERKQAEAPAAAGGQAAAASDRGAESMQAVPASPAAAPAPPPQAPTEAPRRPSNGQGRTMALTEARTDIEAAQRELDVAGGDCRNACRALGSMDRAAGQMCRLAQSDDEVRRCGDAKVRVYSARDRVKNTCGSCPEVSVERADPIPSR